MAEKPVSAGELSQLHARISRDVGDLRSRWVRLGQARRRAAEAPGASGVFGAAGILGANPGDIVNVALRTFRAMRLLQDALGGARSPTVLLLAVLERLGRRR